MAKFKGRQLLNHGELTQNYLTLICIKKNGQVQGETILKPGVADTAKSHIAKVQYVSNFCTNFQKNCSKIV